MNKVGDLLEKTIRGISDLDQTAMEMARLHQGQLAIPYWSLGKIHDLGVKLAGITGDPKPNITDCCVITMAGDHGVVAQGVSKFPQEVTRQMVLNFLKGGAAINVFARHVGARLTVVDMGVIGSPIQGIASSGTRFVTKKIRQGTKDISEGPAMTRDEAARCLEAGISIVLEERDMGLDAVAIGDMGIGNTTPSSAIAAVVLGMEPEKLVNTGTGIEEKALGKKISLVRQAIDKNNPNPKDPIDVLSKVGGLEIGGLAGVILGASSLRIPVVIDGFIATSAALIASLFDKRVRDYMFAGHSSNVVGHREMLEYLHMDPMVDLKMRLGEGTGAALGLFFLKLSSKVAREMLTFEEAEVTSPPQ